MLVFSTAPPVPLFFSPNQITCLIFPHVVALFKDSILPWKMPCQFSPIFYLLFSDQCSFPPTKFQAPSEESVSYVFPLLLSELWDHPQYRRNTLVNFFSSLHLPCYYTKLPETLFRNFYFNYTEKSRGKPMVLMIITEESKVFREGLR